MNRCTIIYCFLLLNLVAIQGNAAAEQSAERWYEIEVIVFKNQTSDIHEELWPTNKRLEFPTNLIDMITEPAFPVPEGFLNQRDYDAQLAPSLELELEANEQTELASQHSSVEETLPSSTDLSDPQDATPTVKPFDLLTSEQLKLSRMIQSLGKSSQYQPLAHYSWRQPVKDRSGAEWVRVVGGRDYHEQFEPNGKAKSEQEFLRSMGLTSHINTEESALNVQNVEAEQTQSTIENTLNDAQNNANVIDETSEQQDVNLDAVHNVEVKLPLYLPVPELDGAVQIYLGRYLHINTQLFIRIPGEETIDISSLSTTLSSSLLNMTNDGVLKSDYESGFSWNFELDKSFTEEPKDTIEIERLLDYSMIQSRRIKSGEIHYFDHPLFGMIIQVRPFDPEAPISTSPSDVLLNQNNSQQNTATTGR